MRFAVEPIVVKIADERRERFGNPNSELTARFDLRFCAAAAWQRGKFTLDEMRAGAYRDEKILDLRSRIDLIADPERKSFDGCALEITFTDQSTESIVIDNFLGSPGRRMSDAQLAEVFSRAAADLLPAGRAAAILDAVWNLDRATNIHGLIELAQLK